jgi:hypothetical protein
MRQTPTTKIPGILLAACAITVAVPVFAGKLDLTLPGFANCDATGSCSLLYDDYETFLSEYAFGIAPKKLAPAETLGFSGFYMGFEASVAVRPTGSAAEERWDLGTPTDEVQAVMFNPGIHIRKGLPFSFELGSTVNYLVLSRLVTLGGEIKWAPFEGYRTGWRAFLPDIAVRGSLVRVIGETDVDMTVVGVDGSVSYAFGVGGMLTLTPYAGYQFTWTVINLEPMTYKDSSGYHSATADSSTGEPLWNADDLGNPLLKRSNLFFGLRIGYEVLAYTIEVDWGLPHSWKTEGDSDVSAEVGHQIQISTGIGVDF